VDTLLALDISQKTGFAVFVDGKLTECGTLFTDKTVSDFGTYPRNYVEFSKFIAALIYSGLVLKFKPDRIVIEETNPGREVYSQKKLEQIHYSFINQLIESGRCDRVSYLRTGEWRKAVTAKQNSEEKKLNSKISREKAKRNASIMSDKNLTTEQKTKAIKLPIKIDGKVAGRKGRKHVSIRVANELFGLSLKRKDEDAAEAALLGQAFLNGAVACDGTIRGGVSK
jgi:hypothetical protein